MVDHVTLTVRSWLGSAEVDFTDGHHPCNRTATGSRLVRDHAHTGTSVTITQDFDPTSPSIVATADAPRLGKGEVCASPTKLDSTTHNSWGQDS